MSAREKPELLVIGAGPAGLTAALEAVRRGLETLVVERTGTVGGIARTEERHGFRFDVGGHRFFTRIAPVERLWRELLGPDLLTVRRLSRIRFRGRLLSYPLRPWEALRAMGPVDSLAAGLSYLVAHVTPHRPALSLEDWLVHAFGRKLYRTFFAAYTEKVWGRPASEIHAGWAAQRIRGLSLRSVAAHALRRRGDHRSLIGEFLYPRLGPGMLWERCARRIVEAGGRILLGTEVTGLELGSDGRVAAVRIEGPDGGRDLAPRQVLSSMPLPHLVERLEPAPPEPVRRAARGLAHRSLVVVCLVLDGPAPFPDQWIYLQEPDVVAGRAQCFGNWSPAMLADPAATSLGLEYFCDPGDGIWSRSDEELVELARADLRRLHILPGAGLRFHHVIRQPAAYPVYDLEFESKLATVCAHLAAIPNLQPIGRNGMHRYNNQDHSMLTGILAVRNLCGEEHDLWSVNEERRYLELAAPELSRGAPPPPGSSR